MSNVRKLLFNNITMKKPTLQRLELMSVEAVLEWCTMQESATPAPASLAWASYDPLSAILSGYMTKVISWP